MQKPELTLLEDTDSDGVADLYLSVADGFDTLASIMNSLTVLSSIREARCSSRRASVHPDTTKPSHLLPARCPLHWDIEAG